jgi:hypothetical protein
MATIFEANYTSGCALCKKRIYPGDDVVSVDVAFDGMKTVHADCADQAGHDVTYEQEPDEEP